MQDGNAVPAADPAADAPNPETRVTDRKPVALLRRPDDMEPVVMDAMRGAVILHVPVLPEMSLRPERAAHFRKDRDITRFVLASLLQNSAVERFFPGKRAFFDWLAWIWSRPSGMMTVLNQQHTGRRLHVRGRVRIRRLAPVSRGTNPDRRQHAEIEYQTAASMYFVSQSIDCSFGICVQLAPLGRSRPHDG